MAKLLLRWLRLSVLALLVPSVPWWVGAAELPAVRSPVTGAFVEVPATAATVQQLRAGGYVLYLRHGTTDNTHPDRTPVVDPLLVYAANLTQTERQASGFSPRFERPGQDGP